MKSGIAMAVMASVFCAPLSAAPAPWYKWRGKIDGAQVCAQISLGEGWEQLPVSYKDARCEKRAAAG